MPYLSRFIIRLSLGYLAGALLVGMVLALPVDQRPTGALQPTYLHLFVVGWLTHLIFGVAYWLFPRHSRDEPYGRRHLAAAGFVVLNVGLVLRLISEPAQIWIPGEVWQWGILTSAMLQWLGGVTLVRYFWTRVKSK